MHFVFDAIVDESAIRQVVSSQYNPGNTERAGRGSGAVDPSIITMVSGAPTATFQSNDLAGVLTLISASAGLFVPAGDVLAIPYNKAVNGGTFDTTDATVIAKVSTAAALLTIQQIAASEDADATVDVLATLLSGDGFTHPVGSLVEQTISGQSFNGLFGFGGVAINGSMDARVTGVTIDTGITLTPEPKMSGFNYPRKVSITQRDPYIDLEFGDMEAVHNYGPNFAALTSAVVYFRKRADGGTYQSGSVHCSASFATGLTSIQQVSANSGSPGRPTIRLWGKALTTSQAATIPSFS